MGTDNIFDEYLLQLNNISFKSETFAYRKKGIVIEYRSPDIMLIRGGNFGLPKHVKIKISAESVRYAFDEDWLKLEGADKQYELDNLEIQPGLHIFSLLDPRMLLKSDNYRILSVGKESNELKILIETNIDRLVANGSLKIPEKFLYWIKERHGVKRISKITLRKTLVSEITQPELPPANHHITSKFTYRGKM